MPAPDALGDRALPARRVDPRAHLPGLETERTVTDWGRSERLEALVDRSVYDFLYHYWFRVEVQDVANVPREGGALLLANHAGVLPPDGVMIVKALREEHPAARRVHLVTSDRLYAVPALGALVTKTGGVSGHPANLHRLLFDERELVLGFPEGQQGLRKPLKDRYRLRAFHQLELLRAALRAEVPVIPVAVMGAEEAMPALARLRGPLARLAPLPLTAPLPAKLRIRFLEAIAPEDVARRADADGDVGSLAAQIRALIQENLLEMAAARRSVWLG